MAQLTFSDLFSEDQKAIKVKQKLSKIQKIQKSDKNFFEKLKDVNDTFLDIVIEDIHEIQKGNNPSPLHVKNVEKYARILKELSNNAKLLNPEKTEETSDIKLVLQGVSNNK